MKANELFQAIFCKSKIPDTVSVTYSELMSLMNNSRLIPKTKYLYTDSFYSATIVRVKNGGFITYQFTESAGEWTKRTITAQ